MTRCLGIGVSALIASSSLPSPVQAGERTGAQPVSIETNFRGVEADRIQRVEPALEKRARDSLQLSGVTVSEDAETVMVFHVRSLAEEPNSTTAVADYGTHIEVLIDGERVGEPIVTFCDQKGEAELVECTLEGLDEAVALLPQEPQETSSSPTNTTSPPPTKTTSQASDSDKTDNPGLPFIISGAAAVALGAGGVIAGSVLHVRERQEQGFELDVGEGTVEERHSKALTIPMIAVGSLALLGGVALIIVGAQKNKNHKKRTTVVTPSFGPQFAGFSLQGRF